MSLKCRAVISNKEEREKFAEMLFFAGFIPSTQGDTVSVHYKGDDAMYEDALMDFFEGQRRHEIRRY